MKIAVEQLFQNLNFTHKVHEKECEALFWASNFLKIVGVFNVVTVLLLQFLQIRYGSSVILMDWSIYLTVLEVGLLIYQLNFNYEKQYELHRSTAKQALAIKNRLLVYKNTSRFSEDGMDKFVEEINTLYSFAPQTGKIAKFLANKSIKEDKE